LEAKDDERLGAAVAFDGTIELEPYLAWHIRACTSFSPLLLLPAK
jgi:hypothetical protein